MIWKLVLTYDCDHKNSDNRSYDQLQLQEERDGDVWMCWHKLHEAIPLQNSLLPGLLAWGEEPTCSNNGEFKLFTLVPEIWQVQSDCRTESLPPHWWYITGRIHLRSIVSFFYFNSSLTAQPKLLVTAQKKQCKTLGACHIQQAPPSDMEDSIMPARMAKTWRWVLPCTAATMPFASALLSCVWTEQHCQLAPLGKGNKWRLTATRNAW